MWHLFLLFLLSLVTAQQEDLATAFNMLNQARQLKNLQPLSWSPDLTAYAQFWADQMGSGAQPFQHAMGQFRPDQGENLYEQQSRQCDLSYDYPFRQAMDAWLGQAPLYNNQPVTGNEAWLHWCKFGFRGARQGGQANGADIAQCMWSTTTQVGCARAFSVSESGKIFVVCRFFPEGNV